MRSFVFTLTFLLLLFNIFLVSADAEGILDRDIQFKTKSITIDGEPFEKCRVIGCTSLTGFIEFYFSGYGRFVFALTYFSGAEKVAEVDEGILEGAGCMTSAKDNLSRLDK